MRKSCFYCLLLFLAKLTIAVYTVQMENEDRIKHLELEKNKLHRDIKAAIDDSLRTLQSTNDTDAEEGIQHLETLKMQIQEIGEDASGLFNDTHNRFESNTTSEEAEDRDHYNDTKSLRNSRRSRKKKHGGPDELDEIFVYKNYNKKKINPQKAKLMLDNRLILDRKLKEWISKRKEERLRLKEYLEKKRINLLASATERCPRFGLGKKKKNKKEIRSGKKEHIAMSPGAEQPDVLNVARNLNADKRKYPCCRKCCKKSYLGCL